MDGEAITVGATLDTGAAFCIFGRDYADHLGLDVESGRPLRFRTATGNFLAYGHNITLTTLGIEFESEVFFAADGNFEGAFVGRRGWLDRLRLAIIDHDQTLHLSHYNQP